MELNQGDKVSLSSLPNEVGTVLRHMSDGEIEVRFSLDIYVLPESSFALVEKAPVVSTKTKQRSWSPEKAKFYFEQYSWLKETGPQHEPFGVKGKMRQAEWRKENNLEFVDPILSNLSLWGGILCARGYVRQLPDGRWAVTEKIWEG